MRGERPGGDVLDLARLRDLDPEACAGLDDRQLEALRATMYGLAHLVFDAFASGSSREHSPPQCAAPRGVALAADEFERYEERAAIREFDGLQSRAQAEEGALCDVIELRSRRTVQGRIRQ